MRSLFFRLAGVAAFFVFSVVEREENRQKMITGNYEFCFYWSKNGRFVTHMLFLQKEVAETPILGARFFGPRCQERENLDTHPKKKKIFTDN